MKNISRPFVPICLAASLVSGCSAITPITLSSGEQDAAELQRKLQLASEEYLKRTAELEAQIKARQELEAKYSELEKRHRDVVRLSERRSAVVQRATIRIARRSLTSAVRNIAGLSGGSIPVVGAVINVALTGLDVNDSCDGIKDANELNNEFGHALEDQTKVCGLRVPTKDEVLGQVTANWREAYQRAAASLGGMVPSSPPALTLPDVRGPVCVVYSIPLFCR